MKTHTFGEITMKVGKNAKENWELVGNAAPEHTWLHLTYHPSPHVIIEHPNPDIDTIVEGALLCKMNSKNKKSRKVKVDYTKCDNLEKGEEEGEVIFKSLDKIWSVFV
jgi:predicted ribosome quality control (RQC) complex YloA/Tae2 family protein